MIARISDTTLQRPGTLSLDWVILTLALLGTSLSVLNVASSQDYAIVGEADPARPAVSDGL